MHRIAALFVLASLSTARAEETPPRTLSVSSNLLGLATLNPNLDLEVRIVGGLTVGATAWWEVRAVEDRWGQMKVAYAFGEHAMRGPFIAGTLGAHRAYRPDEARADLRAQATSTTIGALGGYDFRFGASKAMRLGLVAGAKATLGDHDDASPLRPYYIEARLNLGWVL